MAGPDSSGYCY